MYKVMAAAHRIAKKIKIKQKPTMSGAQMMGMSNDDTLNAQQKQ